MIYVHVCGWRERACSAGCEQEVLCCRGSLRDGVGYTWSSWLAALIEGVESLQENPGYGGDQGTLFLGYLDCWRRPVTGSVAAELGLTVLFTFTC